MYIRYPDGSLRNLTKAFRGAKKVAVREPSVNWEATKVLFSMLIDGSDYWQLYEVTGLGANETPVITKVSNQPNFNNISPVYGTDGRIIFTTDRPRGGELHLYPQLDEYESNPTVTGIWSLDPTNGNLQLLNHAPSGDFTPIIDSYGRVVFTQWDHLKQDQQLYLDLYGDSSQKGGYKVYTCSDESVSCTKIANNEKFPEYLSEERDVTGAVDHLVGHNMNVFFPWGVWEDGTEGEIINHLGRHELTDYIEKVFDNDNNLDQQNGSSTNQPEVRLFMQIKEAPWQQGLYIGVSTEEFGMHSTGSIFGLTAPLGARPVDARMNKLIAGNFRDPAPLGNGDMVVTRANPISQASSIVPEMRLYFVKKNGNSWSLDSALTSGIKGDDGKSLWEWQAVELRARTKPQRPIKNLETVEASVFTKAGVDVDQFKSWLKQNNLALIVMRDVTTRDGFDKQQPFNLRVAGTSHMSGTNNGLYDIAGLQIFQGDQVRGYGNNQVGRRVLAREIHSANFSTGGLNELLPQLNTALKIAPDGSVAGVVPTNRAMTWQLVGPSTTSHRPIVRERVWVTFQPGEIRVCTSCHGLSDLDQMGRLEPTNEPQALKNLLDKWKTIPK